MMQTYRTDVGGVLAVEPWMINQSVLNRELCQNLGFIMKRRNKFCVIWLIAGLLFLFVCFPAMLWLDPEDKTYLALLASSGLCAIIGYLYLDSTYGSTALRGADQRLKDSTISYLFDDES